MDSRILKKHMSRFVGKDIPEVEEVNGGAAFCYSYQYMVFQFR
jgi:hypothetical protein